MLKYDVIALHTSWLCEEKERLKNWLYEMEIRMKKTLEMAKMKRKEKKKNAMT